MFSSTCSAQAEEGQDGEHDDDEADEVNDSVHLKDAFVDALRCLEKT
jgi:hypothetical protein